eukprot:TRINITY_DN50413_c0_g1_i1.p1 TRINITY_DN50413_c0_g1~~TRINITY_DN50413_c0_g1_i1.p1  ORF type:complete len:279 (+),score=90.36 TRINITY_DN50413_c0_g1_i1:122-958(+)
MCIRDRGGTLFLDEAYALADSEDGFSGEAVRTLLTEVENNRTNILVVLAGYEDKMCLNDNSLMKADPGLPRRFCTHIHLFDYTPHQIALICEKVARERFELRFGPGLLASLTEHVEQRHADDIQIHNGGLAVNLTEQAFRRLATRVVLDGLFKTEAATTLVESDYLIGVAPPAESEDAAPSEEEIAADPPVEPDERKSLPDLGTLLESLQLEALGSTLAENEIGVEELCWITEEQLKELGISVGARCRIKKFQAEFGMVGTELRGLRHDFDKLRAMIL